jgi:predicted PurR-regulated permease PerM
MNAALRAPLVSNLLIGASLVVIVAGMRAAASFISPFLLAIFLAVLLYPPYRGLVDRGFPTWLTVSIMVAGVMLVGLGLLALLYLSIESLRSNLFLYATRLTAQRINLETWLESIGIDAPTVLTQELINRQVLITTTARLLTNLGSLIVTGVIVLVTTVFLLLQTTHLSERVDREWGPGNLLNAQAAQIAQRVARFFTIRVRVNLIVATAITLWLAILGVDLAVLWGILAFFLGFIMYIGVTIAALPPAILALAESGLWWAVLAFLGVLLINMGIENIVAPAMMGQGLNLTPAVALASLVFWAWVLGPLGFILAIPLTVIVVMILASNPDSRWLLVLLTMDTIPDTVNAPDVVNAVSAPNAPNTSEQI